MLYDIAFAFGAGLRIRLTRKVGGKYLVGTHKRLQALLGMEIMRCHVGNDDVRQSDEYYSITGHNPVFQASHG